MMTELLKILLLLLHVASLAVLLISASKRIKYNYFTRGRSVVSFLYPPIIKIFNFIIENSVFINSFS